MAIPDPRDPFNSPLTAAEAEHALESITAAQGLARRAERYCQREEARLWGIGFAERHRQEMEIQRVNTHRLQAVLERLRENHPNVTRPAAPRPDGRYDHEDPAPDTNGYGLATSHGRLVRASRLAFSSVHDQGYSGQDAANIMARCTLNAIDCDYEWGMSGDPDLEEIAAALAEPEEVMELIERPMPF